MVVALGKWSIFGGNNLLRFDCIVLRIYFDFFYDTYLINYRNQIYSSRQQNEASKERWLRFEFPQVSKC